MLMGNQHSGQLTGLNAQLPQAFGNAPGRDARVNQNMGPPVGHQQAVPTGPAREGAKLQQKGALPNM